MGKLYKIEFEDYGWSQLLGFLDSYITDLEKTIERFKKEKEKTKDEFWQESYEDLISTYGVIIGLVKGYIRTIRGDLKEQGLELPLFEREKGSISEHIT